MTILLSPCSRVVEAAPLKAIVLPAIENDVGIQLREQDLSWKDSRYVCSNGVRCVKRTLINENKVPLSYHHTKKVQ